jgi:hypothetical protein
VLARHGWARTRLAPDYRTDALARPPSWIAGLFGLAGAWQVAVASGRTLVGVGRLLVAFIRDLLQALRRLTLGVPPERMSRPS